MKYELAKQLKEAGFEQPEENFGGTYLFPEVTVSEPPLELNAAIDGSVNIIGSYAPTLSELIEACGERFNSLGHGFKDWFADGLIELEDTNSGVIGRGDNPIIAVTKLYIELHK